MAVKRYNLAKDGAFKLSEHFAVREFRSYDDVKGKLYSSEVLIDEQLVTKLEELFKRLKCSKIIITSGYRTLEHEKTLGGSGKGQHVQGRAADIICYDICNKVIPAQIVCCVAQDVGFAGIANISANYRAVHVDVRTEGRYLGDEIKGYHTVCDSFYEYFKKTPDDIRVYTG